MLPDILLVASYRINIVFKSKVILVSIICIR